MTFDPVDKAAPDRAAKLGFQIARDVFDRRCTGLVLVVVDDPAAIAATTRKRWEEIRQQVGLSIEHLYPYSMTDDKLAELEALMAQMQATEFVVGEPRESKAPLQIAFVTAVPTVVRPIAAVYVDLAVSVASLDAAAVVACG